MLSTGAPGPISTEQCQTRQNRRECWSSSEKIAWMASEYWPNV